MLRALAHPCVVAMQDVFYEKVFVCLVMNIITGGDMTEGMQHHWKHRGLIPIPVVRRLAKMMVSSVEWLHQNGVVHRDVKGDNFLMNVKDIQDPSLQVFLSDFGTVVAVTPDERL